MRRGIRSKPDPKRDIDDKSFARPAKLIDNLEDIKDGSHKTEDQRNLARLRQRANAPSSVLKAAVDDSCARAPAAHGAAKIVLSGESPAASRVREADATGGSSPPRQAAGSSLQKRRKPRANTLGASGAQRTAERMERKEAEKATSETNSQLLSALTSFKRDVLEQQQSQQALLVSLGEEVSMLRAERVAAAADRERQQGASGGEVASAAEPRTWSNERGGGASYMSGVGGERTQASNTHVCVCVHGASGSSEGGGWPGPFDA